MTPRVPARRTNYALAAVILLLGPFAALTTAVMLTAPEVFAVDAEVADGLHGFVLDRPGLGTALQLVGLITMPNTFRLIALVSAWLLWRRGQRRAAGWLIVTMAIGGLLSVVLRQVFARSRPEWAETISDASGYGYPSGHAVNSMLAAGCAIILLDQVLSARGRRLLWASAAVLVLLVGFDRVALGVHYLTDVLAGWAMALIVLFTTLAAFGPLTPSSSEDVSEPGLEVPGQPRR